MAAKSVSTVNFGDAANKFIKAGIHPRWLLPIAPVGAPLAKNATISDKVLGKAPGRFNEPRALWSGLGGASIVKGVTKADHDEMRSWPTSSVGVIGRAFPGIDSDANSEKARRLVDRALVEAFPSAVYAERIRGKGPRRLYAFKCVDPQNENAWVRTRHITYKLDGEDIEHKLDVIGYGGQYLVTGIHPSGDAYEWEPDAQLYNPALVEDLAEIDNDDMGRFVETFRRLVSSVGGEILRASGGRGGGNADFDLRKLEPSMSIDDVLDGLDAIPNTPDNFLHRDDFVSMLAATRAALGKDSFRGDVEDDVRAWATKDPEWCDDEYFDKVWKSLEHTRVEPDALDRVFRRNGVKGHIKNVFPAAKERHEEIDREKAKAKDMRVDVLDAVASRYLFGDVNTRDKQASLRMRDRWAAAEEWVGIDWWKFKSTRSDVKLLDELHEMDGYGGGEVGFFNLCRDLRKKHPEIWYSGETRNPNFDRGEIVEETQPDGSVKRELNMRFISPAIRMARKPDPDPRRSQEDVAHILDFVKRAFGSDEIVDYELDTLAYMAQTGDRPGSMLFFVGDSGVGKSLWLSILAATFDGSGPEQSGVVDGAKLSNENARRFILAKVEGCRILTIKELPKGKHSSAKAMSEITSTLKQIVDAGPEGDFVIIEDKNVPAKPVRNFFRVAISSNYTDAIGVEEQDRRIFYVRCQISQENKPDEQYYQRLVDIYQDPARLAAFFRYLLSRDIKGYSRHKAPPVSQDKAERIIMTIDNPVDRHSRAALELLLVSRRECFTIDELFELMSEMSENEFINTNGEFDDRARYEDEKDRVKLMSLSRQMISLRRQCTRVEIRTPKRRMPAVYAFKKYERTIYDLEHLPFAEAADIVYDDREQRGVSKTHPWHVYAKPV